MAIMLLCAMYIAYNCNSVTVTVYSCFATLNTEEGHISTLTLRYMSLFR